MEQLRKAVLQAQKEREALGSKEDFAETDLLEKSSSEDQAISAPTEHSDSVSTESSQFAPSEVEIEYIDTKVVELSDDVLEANRVLHSQSSPEVVQAYKMLRTQVLQKLKLNNWNSLAVVSPTSGNGKTLTAINLAVSLAQEVKHSVLLVDFDFINPSIAQTFGVDIEFGVSDYLFRDEQIKNILFNPGVERLTVLGGTESLVHSSEALGSPKMIALVEELKVRYPNRIVIFDLPPMLISDDAIAFAPYVDSMLLVIEEAKTTPSDLELCADMLGNKPLLGSVLNKASA